VAVGASPAGWTSAIVERRFFMSASGHGEISRDLYLPLRADAQPKETNETFPRGFRKTADT
jgi:23S rRNA C2498 (ribose-2'-O)-methylase RlmM